MTSENKNFKIIEFKKKDILIVYDMFPKSWAFNFYKFIELYFNLPFFKGFSLVYEKRVVGFGNLFYFGQIGWLGNIVVSDEYRNRGLGTKITKHLIQYGQSIGIKSFFLIATDLGAPVYKKLGFKIDQKYGFYHSGNKSANSEEKQKNIYPAEKKDLKNIIDLDLYITGENRKLLLEYFLSDTSLIYDESNKIRGFYIKNFGNGLIHADNMEYGLALLKYKIKGNGSKIILPLKNEAAIEYLKSNQYKHALTLPRMVLGKVVKWKSELVFSRGTGYLG